MKAIKAAALGGALILLGHAVSGCGSDSSDGTGGTAGTAGTGGDGQGATSQGGNSQGGDSSGGNNVAGNGGSPSDGGAGVGGDGQGGAGNVGQGGSGGSSGECIGCAEYITSCFVRVPPPRCGNDFCAGSTDIFDALAACVCADCAADCELTCTGQGTDNACAMCQQESVSNGCSTEFADCSNDI